MNLKINELVEEEVQSLQQKRPSLKEIDFEYKQDRKGRFFTKVVARMKNKKYL